MSNKKQDLIPPPRSPQLPATVKPTPSLPSLPTGNATLGPLHSVYDRNRRAVEASANYYRARADQALACVELLSAREKLLLQVARLRSLPEMATHQEEKGRLDRLNELRLIKLQHELDETNARIALAIATTQLASYTPQPPEPPQPPAPPPSPPPTGLDPREVEAVLQRFPDIKPESIEPIIMMLRGVLAEKKS